MDKYRVLGSLYQNVFKPLAFQIDAEIVHEGIVSVGEGMENIGWVLEKLLSYRNQNLEREVLGIKFANPVGLAAGFDYDGHLSQVLKDVGFGFNTVGTVTAKPYEGNSGVRLGRLPKSKSLFVNKGFKSEGAKKVAERLDSKNLDGHTIGVSVGSSNLLSVNTIPLAIEDYLQTFEIFKKKKYLSYFELNISCPNTSMTEGFSVPKNFEKLVKEVKSLKFSKPIFVKMPNEIENSGAEELVRIALKHDIHGFIFSNLVKNRNNTSLDQKEASKFTGMKGNFSGKPTLQNSLRLVSSMRKKFGKEIAIVGCGGIFNAFDAIERLNAGADLVQLITGMVYMGPQIVGEINRGIAENMKNKK